MTKIYYDPVDDLLLIYIGKSSLPYFKRFVFKEEPLGVCAILNKYCKQLIYVGTL